MIGHVTPEAHEGGPIAIVQNGDMIKIDVATKELALVCFVSFSWFEEFIIFLSYRNCRKQRLMTG